MPVGTSNPPHLPLANSPAPPYLPARPLPGPLESTMTVTPTTSLIDRAGIDRDRVAQHLGRGLEGADDGELFLEYRQSEMLLFDNGRLKQATYDTSQGFGLRAVKGEAVGYAHATDVS